MEDSVFAWATVSSGQAVTPALLTEQQKEQAKQEMMDAWFF